MLAPRSYEVRKRTKNTVKEIADLVVRNPNDSGATGRRATSPTSNSSPPACFAGIVYCLSRKDCETVSAKLSQELVARGHPRIGVTYYHAGIEDLEQRKRQHSMWSNDDCKVRCCARVDVTAAAAHVTTHGAMHRSSVQLLPSAWASTSRT